MYLDMWLPSSVGELHLSQWQLEERGRRGSPGGEVMGWVPEVPVLLDVSPPLVVAQSGRDIPAVDLGTCLSCLSCLSCPFCLSCHLVEISSPFLMATWDLSSRLQSGSFW